MSRYVAPWIADQDTWDSEEMPEVLDYILGQRARKGAVTLRTSGLEGQLVKGDEQDAEGIRSHPGSVAYS